MHPVHESGSLPDHTAVLPRAPDHDLIAPIAAGAYGEVWLARNVVGTLRAVKIVRRDRHESSESFEREFKGLQKFEPISRSHEGLVDILTLGLLPDNAGFYYVMELADQAIVEPKTVAAEVTRLTSPESKLESKPPHVGYIPRTLRADLKSRTALPADEVIALGLKLTAALAHLHAQGLVHRDVKPSNILFIGGEAKLADAGLVAAMDDARSLVGTAGYIAPEGPGTPQADLYALGKVLYEAAFGKDRHEFPALPLDVASRADHGCLLELNEVLLRACANNARERYQSVERMRAELEALHRGKSIKQQRAARRHFKIAQHFVAAAVVISSLLLGVFYFRKLFALRGSGEESSAYTFNASGAEDRKAFDLFLQGIEAIRDETPWGYLKAIRRFESAVALDSQFARAWSKMAFCWSQLDLKEHTPPSICRPKARAAALKALELDETLAEAHVTLGFYLAFFEWNWIDAESELRKALQLDSSADQQLSLATLLSLTGRLEEAIQTVRRVLEKNPEKLKLHWTLGIYLSYMRRNEEAKAEINQYLDVAPLSPSPRFYLAKILWREGKYDEAMTQWERFQILVNDEAGTEGVAHEAFRQAGGGPNGVAAYCRVWLDRMERVSANRKPDEWIPPMDWVWFYMLAGDLDNAFLWLERALDERQPLVILAVSEPFWEPLWKDPRFDTVLRRTGLDKYFPERMHDKSQ